MSIHTAVTKGGPSLRFAYGPSALCVHSLSLLLMSGHQPPDVNILLKSINDM